MGLKRLVRVPTESTDLGTKGTEFQGLEAKSSQDTVSLSFKPKVRYGGPARKTTRQLTNACCCLTVQSPQSDHRDPELDPEFDWKPR